MASTDFTDTKWKTKNLMQKQEPKSKKKLEDSKKKLIRKKSLD
jgi:hypothetical protein